MDSYVYASPTLVVQTDFTITLENIRFMIERDVKDVIENADVVLWSNQVNADIGVNINVPSTYQVDVNTTDLEFDEPPGIKVITRLWLQSDFDNGINREYRAKYRRYGNRLVFDRYFPQDDILNVDYFKQLNYFTSIKDKIEFEDVYSSLYVFYGVMKYYGLPTVSARIGEAQARQNMQLAQSMYANVKQQLLSLYALAAEPVVIEERW